MYRGLLPLKYSRAVYLVVGASPCALNTDLFYISEYQHMISGPSATNRFKKIPRRKDYDINFKELDFSYHEC